PRMRLAVSSMLLCALAGCASDAARHCSELAGPGWMRMSNAPDNAEALLAMEGLPNDADALWFAKDDRELVACIYAGGLTSPGCGAAMVYQYVKVEDRWTFRSTAMEACQQDF